MRVHRLAAVGLVLMLVAACSDDSGEGSATTTTVASSTTPEPGGAVTDDDRKLADDFIAWARSQSERVPPLADSLRLLLGPEVHTEVVLSDPYDRSGWVLSTEQDDLWRAYIGPFEPLDHLAGPRNVSVVSGPHQTCNVPAVDAPADLASLRQITIEATDVDSCLQWYSIRLFVNDAGLVEAVIFDAYEP
jgi:hypothetical protein